MSDLYEAARSILSKKNKTFNWLADEIGYSRQGLKSGLVNRTIKIEALEKVAETLEVDINEFLVNPGINLQINLENYFENEVLSFISSKFKTFYEKLSLYKDVFIWKVLTLSISGGEIKFPSIDHEKFIDIKNFKSKESIINFPNEMINKPYSQWGLRKQLEFRTNYKVIDAYHFLLFESNLLKITDLIEGELIKDKEIIGYYNKWKK